MATAPDSRASILELLALLPRAGRSSLVALVTVTLAQAAIPLVIIAATGVLVARVTEEVRLGAVAVPLGVLAASLALQQVISPVQGAMTYRATSRIDGSLRVRAMEAAARPAGIELLEDEVIQDRIEVAAGKPSIFRSATPGGAAVAVVGLAARFARAGGSAVLVARFSPLLAFALLAGTIALRRHGHQANHAQAVAFNDHIAPYRRAGYLSGLATQPAAAKETRVFGLADWLLNRYDRTWDTVTSSMSAVRHRTLRRLAGGYLLVAPLHALVFVVAGSAAVDGRIGLGVLAVVLQASRDLIDAGQIGNEEYQIDFGAASLPALVELEERSAALASAVLAGTRSAAGLPQHSLRFAGVSFSYPGAVTPVFDHLDLEIPAGTSLAIVGANGAGKTTLVKLLARLYEPDAGRITIDGIDVQDLDPSSWRARLAVIFQDFVRYELPARDNVGLGGLARVQDPASLFSAADRAGARVLIEDLPKGWDTVLARGYTDGADLSGGEWQRVALARALMALEAGAGVLALDEPTANLDVRAEAALFDRFLDMTEGSTTILISHRFSTVRRADHICVLDGGREVERGTHDELLAAGGHYARMFRRQASHFDG